MCGRATLIGRLGQDVEIRTTQSGSQVATVHLATSGSRMDKDSGEWKEDVQWHTIVTFQQTLVKSLGDRAKKGARALIEGTLKYRRWRK
jgi:single-strand DNA-binding protein